MFSDTLSPPDTASEPPRPSAAMETEGQPAPAASPVYAWDDLQLDVGGGQLSRAGVPLPLEARALAALACLVRFRHRVVSADELRQAVWQDRPNVTDNAIMRAISQARAALGESGRDGCIRTVARVGYRFTGALRGAAVGTDRGAPGPLALLAFENGTGDARLAWIELGLMALTIHLLGGGVGGTGVLPPATVMQALHLASGPSRRAREEAMVRVAPAARVVHTVVTACDGGFLARCQVPGGPDGLPVEARAPSLAELATALAQALRAHFALAAPAGGPPAGGPLAMQCLARALEAVARQQPNRALPLLDLTLALDPDNHVAELERIRALSNLGSPLTLWRARRLRARAERQGDVATAAWAAHCVARMYAHRNRWSAAVPWLARSLAEVSEQAHPEVVAASLMLEGAVRIGRLDYRDMDALMDRLHRLCTDSGNRLLEVSALTMQAITAMALGDLPRALGCIEEAVRQSRLARSQGGLIAAADNAAWVLARMGRLADARLHSEEAVAATLANDLGRGNSLEVLGTLCWVRHLARDGRDGPDGTRLADIEARVPHTPYASRILGLRALAQGDAAMAVQHLRRAVQVHRDGEDPYHEEEALPWLLDALVLAGELDEAEAELRVAGSARLDTAHVRGQLPLAQARLAHARGEPARALALLEVALARALFPLQRFWAGLDVAWLRVGAGDLAGAEQALAGLPPVLARHPLAHACRARVALAAGRAAAAVEHQRRCLELLAPRRPPAHLALLAACEDAAEGRRVPAQRLAALPLPSLL